MGYRIALLPLPADKKHTFVWESRIRLERQDGEIPESELRPRENSFQHPNLEGPNPSVKQAHS
jgi:hypothetical protein